MVFRVRSRSFTARSRMGPRTFKRRSFSVGRSIRKGTRRVTFARKSKKFIKPKVAARKAFKVAKFKNKNTSRLLTLTKGVADQTFIYSYVDLFQVKGTTGSAAIQGMWAVRNSSAGTAGATNQPLVNLQLMSNDILQMLLGQPAAAGTGFGNQTTSQLIVKSYETTMELRNLTTGPIKLWEYRCTARKDLTSGTGSASIAGIIATGFGDATARTGGSVPFTSPVGPTTLGATVFMNPRFVAVIKVRKVKQWTLAPARSKRLKYVTRKPRLVRNEDFQYGQVPDPDGSTATTRQISKGQSFSVFCTHGTFASNTDGAAGFQIGYGSADVGITAGIKVHYAVVQNNTMTSAATTAAPGFDFNVCAYPAPVVQNQPISAISTGPTPAAAGSRVYAAIGSDPAVIADLSMLGPTST